MEKSYKMQQTKVFEWYQIDPDAQFSIQNFQTSPIPQTSFLPWTFFDVSYSNTAPAYLEITIFCHFS